MPETKPNLLLACFKGECDIGQNEARDHALLLWGILNGHVEAGAGWVSTVGLTSEKNYDSPVDPFDCLILTPALRDALMALMEQEQS